MAMFSLVILKLTPRSWTSGNFPSLWIPYSFCILCEWHGWKIIWIDFRNNILVGFITTLYVCEISHILSLKHNKLLENAKVSLKPLHWQEEWGQERLEHNGKVSYLDQSIRSNVTISSPAFLTNRVVVCDDATLLVFSNTSPCLRNLNEVE